MKEIFCVAVMVFLLSGCKAMSEGNEDITISEPELIINSGFEPNSELFVYNPNILGIRGIDLSQSSTSDWGFHGIGSDIGDYYFKLEENGNISDRNVEIVKDPQLPTNSVVKMLLKYPTEPDPLKGRVQMEIGENENLRDAFVSFRLFISQDYSALEDFTFASGDWLTLMELWGEPDVPISEQFPFRITLYIIKSLDNANLVLGLRADKIDRVPLSIGQESWMDIWEQRSSIRLPIGEWVKVEMYYHEGNSTTGRFYLSIQKENQTKDLLFDIHNVTRHPDDPNPSGLRWINPVKIYCSSNVLDHVNGKGKTLSLMFDDFVLWKNRVPE